MQIKTHDFEAWMWKLGRTLAGMILPKPFDWNIRLGGDYRWKEPSRHGVVELTRVDCGFSVSSKVFGPFSPSFSKQNEVDLVIHAGSPLEATRMDKWVDNRSTAHVPLGLPGQGTASKTNDDWGQHWPKGCISPIDLSYFSDVPEPPKNQLLIYKKILLAGGYVLLWCIGNILLKSGFKNI